MTRAAFPRFACKNLKVTIKARKNCHHGKEINAPSSRQIRSSQKVQGFVEPSIY